MSEENKNLVHNPLESNHEFTSDINESQQHTQLNEEMIQGEKESEFQAEVSDTQPIITKIEEPTTTATPFEEEETPILKEKPRFREDGVLIQGTSTAADEPIVDEPLFQEEAAPVVEATIPEERQPEIAATTTDGGGNGNNHQPPSGGQAAGNGGGGDEPPKRPKKKKSGLMAGLTGGIVGAVLTASLITYVPPFNEIRGNAQNNAESTMKNPTKKSEITADVTTDTTKAVEKVQDAVVSIKNLKAQSNNLNYYSQKDTNKSSEDDLETVGEGSGVIYKKDGDKAYIVTNNHVIDGSDAIEVTLRDGTKLEAKLVGTDQWTDLAVLSVSSKDIETVAEFGDSDSIKQGEPAIAIGSPLGSNFAGSVTQGIISAKDRLVDMDINGDGVADWDMNAIQTDAAINPGNSGGALINISGQVIGINSMKISDNLVEGMGFAIPSNEVVEIINQLESNGKITRPMLGIELRDLATISGIQQRSILNLPEDVTEGVVVTKTMKDTTASKAGLEKYDTIVEINGEKTPDSMTLRKVLYKAGVGKEVEIKYYRDGKLKTTKVTLEATQDDL